MKPCSALFVLALAACGEKEPAPDSEPVTPADDSQPIESEPPAPVDEDKDGHLSDVDCDDNNYRVHPGATETCDGVDEDCDGAADEDFDVDADGALDAGACAEGTDCDDRDPATYTGAPEQPYDGVDQDCDGEDLVDADGDRFDALEAGGNDCDDEDPATYPGAPELPKDGVDQDCDGADSLDGDGDGYGDATLGGDDCDDDDANIHPDALEWINDNLDNDCDGSIDTTDLLTDAPVSVQGGASNDLVGRGLALCDLDNDGLAELVVAAPFADSYAGEIGVFYGSGWASWTADMTLSAADTVIAGDSTDFIGFGVACGDFDGDGFADLAIGRGEINYSPYRTDWGILLFYGDGARLDAALSDSKADAELSLDLGAPSKATVYSSVFIAGDVDGDGDDELLVTLGHSDLSLEDGEEHIRVVDPGRQKGRVTLTAVQTHLFDAEQDAQLGGVEVVQDHRGDGSPDLAVLSPAWHDTASTDTGDWVVASGRVDLLELLPASGDDLLLGDHRTLGFTGTSEALAFGSRLVEGDFDGDGALDLAISSTGGSPEGRLGAGGLFVFSHSATALSALDLDPMATADAVIWGDQDEAYFGWALANPGDVDGDGADELLVSAPQAGLSAVGRVYLLSGALMMGAPALPEDAALVVWQGDDPDSVNGYELSAAGDIDGDGIRDLAVVATGWDSSHSSSVSSGKVYLWLSSLW